MTWNRPLSSIQPPCRGCEERHDLCHSDCEKDLGYRAKIDAQKKKCLEELEVTSALKSLQHKMAISKKGGGTYSRGIRNKKRRI